MSDVLGLIHRRGACVHRLPITSDWVAYRTGIDTADTEPVGLDTPAHASSAYHHATAPPKGAIDVAAARTLFVRFRTAATAKSVIVVPVLWGMQPGSIGPGLALPAMMRTSRAYRAGTGAAGDYLTAPLLIDVGWATHAHLFVISLGGDSSVDVEFALSSETHAEPGAAYGELLDTWTCSVTSTSKTLYTLRSSVYVGRAIREIALTPEDSTANIRWAKGAASAATGKLPGQGISLPISYELATQLQFYAASTSAMTVTELG